jgi:hypothetical protein
MAKKFVCLMKKTAASCAGSTGKGKGRKKAAQRRFFPYG